LPDGRIAHLAFGVDPCISNCLHCVGNELQCFGRGLGGVSSGGLGRVGGGQVAVVLADVQDEHVALELLSDLNRDGYCLLCVGGTIDRDEDALEHINHLSLE